jgi:hypothetical protein
MLSPTRIKNQIELDLCTKSSDHVSEISGSPQKYDVEERQVSVLFFKSFSFHFCKYHIFLKKKKDTS